MSFTSNFAFMQRHEPKVAELGARAEQYFTDDPNVCLFRLRQLIEQLALAVAHRHRVFVGDDDNSFALIQKLVRMSYIGTVQAGLFHQVRKAGNEAVHDLEGRHSSAAKQLRNTRNLCVWFEGQFGDPDFKPPRFRLPPPPPDTSAALAEAHAQQEALERRLAESERARAAYEGRIAAQAVRLSQPRVVFSTEFMGFWRALADETRATVGAALQSWRSQPDGVSLQTLPANNPAFRWLPLEGATGSVVVVSPSGDVQLAVWVGERLEAERWVQRRRVEVHPQLGSLQVFEVVDRPADPTSASLFAAIDDDELQLCGVPRLLLPAVRSLEDRDALAAFASFLPAEAADTLFAIADGQAPEDARREAGLRAPKGAVDTRDFDVALSHQASRRTFAELDDARFEEMLTAPIEEWRLFLHPSQSKVVRTRAKGPVRVLGGAGTGKTVALLHRAAYLLRHVLSPDEPILITTFTRTMARELENDLARLLSPEEMKRVHASTLHQWCASHLRTKGKRLSVVSPKDKKALWETAIAEHSTGDRPAQFYTDEWDLVVQAQGVQTRSAYFQARRHGRGTRLNRRGRAAVWKVFEAYRAGLEASGKVEWPDLIRITREELDAAPAKPFRSVLVDEVQDFGQAELELLRALVPKAPADMFLVGDAHQRIYQLGCSFGTCGIHVRGRSHRLKVNYRTTERIQQFALSVLDGVDVDDLDGGTDHLRGYHSLRLGNAPEVRVYSTSDEEKRQVVRQVQGWLDAGMSPAEIVVGARTGWILGGYKKALLEAGLSVFDLGGRGDAPADAVRLSTMHRLKGTEFSHVLLAGVQAGVVPLALSGQSDAAAVEDHEKAERCLLYVAATRARDVLIVTGSGAQCGFLPAR